MVESITIGSSWRNSEGALVKVVQMGCAVNGQWAERVPQPHLEHWKDDTIYTIGMVSCNDTTPIIFTGIVADELREGWERTDEDAYYPVFLTDLYELGLPKGTACQQEAIRLWTALALSAADAGLPGIPYPSKNGTHYSIYRDTIPSSLFDVYECPHALSDPAQRSAALAMYDQILKRLEELIDGFDPAHAFKLLPHSMPSIAAHINTMSLLGSYQVRIDALAVVDVTAPTFEQGTTILPNGMRLYVLDRDNNSLRRLPGFDKTYNSGIYFLLGIPPIGSPYVYVGQSKNHANRFLEHRKQDRLPWKYAFIFAAQDGHYSTKEQLLRIERIANRATRDTNFADVVSSDQITGLGEDWDDAICDLTPIANALRELGLNLISEHTIEEFTFQYEDYKLRADPHLCIPGLENSATRLTDGSRMYVMMKDCIGLRTIKGFDMSRNSGIYLLLEYPLTSRARVYIGYSDDLAATLNESKHDDMHWQYAIALADNYTDEDILALEQAAHMAINASGYMEVMSLSMPLRFQPDWNKTFDRLELFREAMHELGVYPIDEGALAEVRINPPIY